MFRLDILPSCCTARGRRAGISIGIPMCCCPSPVVPGAARACIFLVADKRFVRCGSHGAGVAACAAGTRREINREIQAVRCSIGRPRPVAASIGREVKSIRREEDKISNDLQADAISMNLDGSRLRCHIPILRYAGGTGAIAQNSFRGNIYPFRYHLTPAGVKPQGRATCCRTLPGKSL